MHWLVDPMALVQLLLVGSGAVHAAAPPKMITTILIDDLGSYDTAVNNPDIAWLTPTLQRLSHEEGLRLNRYYVNKFCSPTRRAYLTGRFPVSVSMIQAQPCDNTLPLQATLLSEKLKEAPTPWANHFVGKGHLGYPTSDHLPINRGFDSHVGYLCGAENYVYGENENNNPNHDCAKSMHGQCTYDFWHDHGTGESIHDEVFYSTNYYTTRAVAIVRNHTEHAPAGQGLWLHLMYQGVHSPYVDSPEWEQVPNSTQSNAFWDLHPFGDMLRAVDTGIANYTSAIRAVPGLWEETLLICTSDNGGIGPGNNYPLRGHKATPWEGGTKVMGFLSGGFLPASLYGKTHEGVVHVADFYPTICNLAGVVDCTDNKTFPGDPSPGKVRPIDGHDVWPLITSGAPVGENHEWMPVTPDSIIYQERWKLIVRASSTYWYIPTCGSSPPLASCCNATCKAALSDRTGGDWPCRGPSPPPPSPAAKCQGDIPAGYDCHAKHFCGPTESFYWSGKLDLSQCAAACSSNSTCHCFDFKTRSDGTASGSEVDMAACRLHISAGDVTTSGAGYSAFVKSTSDAAIAERERADSDFEHRLALDNVGGQSGVGDGKPEACNVCTPEFPCLFDLVDDITERKNLASAQPQLVKQMQAKLATYEAYFGHPIDPELLAEKYDCPADVRPWYGNFSGPCCRRRAP
eukprot:COSAG02_NODE_3371_length_6857_cov_12.629328_2_plen_686_part_00